MADLIGGETFCWRELAVVSSPATFRDFLSDELIERLQNPAILDNKITHFTYTPCTQIYCLCCDEDIYLFVAIGTNEIDELNYIRDGKTTQSISTHGTQL